MTDIYVTKYALSSGIFKIASKSLKDGFASYRKSDSYECFVHGNDFHLTEEAAKARAEEMRTKKLISIRKQATKLMNMTFDNIEVVLP